MVVLSEVRWSGKGEIVPGNHTMFYSGEFNAKKGIVVALRNNIVKRVTKVECSSDRSTFVKISAKPVDIVRVQVYMPITDHDDEEIIKTTTRSEHILHQEERNEEKALVMEDY